MVVGGFGIVEMQCALFGLRDYRGDHFDQNQPGEAYLVISQRGGFQERGWGLSWL